MPRQIGWTVSLWLVATSMFVATPAVAQGGAGAALLQYRSGGHILGFGPGWYYLSNGTYALKVEFVGATPVAPTAEAGHTEAGRGAAPLGRVRYPGLWKGISVQYDAPGVGIARSTWRLEPGADPRAICLRYNRPVKLSSDGTLAVWASQRGLLSESAPIAWQEVDGERRPVQVAFAIRESTGATGGSEVGFALGTYRRALPLEIDPTLQWTTFLGDSGDDIGFGVAADGNGNVYATGRSFSAWGNPRQAFTDGDDPFAAKLDAATGTLIWNTFLGSTSDEFSAIAVDRSGNVYVTGASVATWGTPVRPFTSGTEGFAAKLDAATGALVWNTFLGGSGGDTGSGIVADGSGNVYVIGTSIGTWGSPVQPYTPGIDAFVAKLDATSGTLVWNAFLAGSGGDNGFGIAADGSGNLYVTGFSAFPWGSPVRAFTPGADPFVARLDATTGMLMWNTFLGNSGGDYASSIAADGSGNVYVTGVSDGTWGSPVLAFTPGTDAFAAKLDAASGALMWNTFLGATVPEGAAGTSAITVDGSGNVYVAGSSIASWGSPLQPFSPGINAFAATLDSASGALVWNTFIGTGDAAGAGIAVDGSGNVYVTGVNNTQVSPNSVGLEPFVAKLGPSISPIPTLRLPGLALLALLLAAVAMIALRRHSSGLS